MQTLQGFRSVCLQPIFLDLTVFPQRAICRKGAVSHAVSCKAAQLETIIHGEKNIVER